MNKTIIFLSFIIFSLLSFQYVNATLITSEAGTKRIQSIAIVIDENTYNQIKNEIDRFKIDIINDLSTEEIEIQIFLNNGSWESADELREYFRDLYTDYDLIGAILIGDVPTYYYLTPVGSSSYPNFPSDYPFADLDCELIDSDNDGLIENQNRSRYWGEITHREIWVSRIKPPINGSGGIALLRQYFDRNHQYRTGGLPYQQKVLVLDSLSIFDNGYTEEQYMERWETVINRTTLFDDSTLLYSNIPNELKQEYLNELKNPYEFGIAEIHGTPTKQIINIHVPSSESGRINYTEILETNTEILFYLLESCSNARFDQDNYLGGWYLFSGSGLWVFGLTTPQAVPSDIEGLNTIRLFSLSTGLTLGDIFKILTDNPGFVSLGDPTLTIRAPVTSPKIVTDQEIDFGGIEIDTQKEVMINISNVGSEKLIINQVYNMYELVGGDYCPPEEMTCAEPFYQTLHNLKEIEINETKTFGIKFMPTTLPGVYRGVIILITNDKDNPLFKIKLEGIGSGEGETLEIETEHVIEITPIDTKEIIIRKCPAGCTCTEETITCSIEEEMNCPIGCVCITDSLECPTIEEKQITEENIQASIGNEEVVIERSTSNQLSIKTENAVAITNEKLIIGENILFIATLEGKKEIRILPEEASSKTTEITTIREIELIEESQKPIYSIKGTTTAKLLLVVPVDLYIEIKVDAETGYILTVNKPWWSFLAW